MAIDRIIDTGLARRELRHAQIYRSPTSPTVVDTFVAQQADVVAGVKQQLKATGFVAESLRRHRIEGLSVAPPAAS